MLEQVNKVKLLCVNPTHVRHVWPMVSRYIDRAYEAVDAHVPQSLFVDLCAARCLLWIVSDEANDIVYVFITEIYDRRSGEKVCRLVVGAGERMEEWLHLQSQLEDYARAEGCVKIVAEGRPGWARALDGYREIRRVIEKDL